MDRVAFRRIWTLLALAATKTGRTPHAGTPRTL